MPPVSATVGTRIVEAEEKEKGKEKGYKRGTGE